MCRCRELHERVQFLEEALSEAEWDLRYRSMIEGTDRNDPNRRIQLHVAYDLARARLGMLSQRRATAVALAQRPADREESP